MKLLRRAIWRHLVDQRSWVESGIHRERTVYHERTVGDLAIMFIPVALALVTVLAARLFM